MSKPKQELDPILKELNSIKKLLVLLLYAEDFPSQEISKAADMDQSKIRGLFSKKKIKKARVNKGENSDEK